MRATKGTLVKRGKVFYALWYHKGKRYRVTTNCTTKREAEKRLAELVAPFMASSEVAVMQAIQGRLSGVEQAEADLLDAANPPLKIAGTWQAFLDSPRRPDSGERTLTGYESHWNRFEEWTRQQEPRPLFLRDVQREHADRYAADLNAAKLSASTFNQHRGLLRLVWRCLGDDARCTLNPWESIAPKKLNALTTRKRALTPAQFEALLLATEDDTDLHDLLSLLAWTGLRLIDGVMLKWGAIDFARGVISLAPQKTARRSGKMVHIPLFPAARALLDSRQAGTVIDLAAGVFPALVEEYERDRGATLSKRISAAFEKAGIETTAARSDRARNITVYGAHSLRHFFVTAATSAGIPAAMIKSITGHATDSMLEHYQQIGVDLAGEIAARIGTDTPALPAVASDGTETAKDTTELKAALNRILDALSAGDTDTAWKGTASLLASLE